MKRYRGFECTCPIQKNENTIHFLKLQLLFAVVFDLETTKVFHFILKPPLISQFTLSLRFWPYMIKISDGVQFWWLDLKGACELQQE